MRPAGLLGAAALLLGGCATNTLRLDRATALGAAGGRAAQGTRDLLAQVDAANRQSAIDVAALDPACTLPTPLIAAGPPALVCRVGPRQPGDFELHRLDPRDFQPALTVIEALTGYLGAVDAIVTEKAVDYGAAFADAQGKLAQVSGDVATIAGAQAPSVLTADQAAAVASALTLIGTLADEQDRVRRLRALESPAQRARFKETTASLRRIDGQWTKVLGSEVDKQALAADLALQIQKPSPGEMRDLRTRQMDAIERLAATRALGQDLARAIDALDAGHDAYLDLLTDAGAHLSAAERRRRASLIETRLLAALDGLATLVRAF